MTADFREAVTEEAEASSYYEDESPDVAPDLNLKKASARSDSPVQNWNYISLSEESVVIKLIRTRSLVDTYYVAQRYANPSNIMSCDGLTDFAENILTTYFDLDTLISECGLTPDETDLVTNMMDGYTVRDLVDEYSKYACSADVFTALDGAARKIVRRNDERWEQSIEMAHKRYCKKFCDGLERHKNRKR